MVALGQVKTVCALFFRPSYRCTRSYIRALTTINACTYTLSLRTPLKNRVSSVNLEIDEVTINVSLSTDTSPIIGNIALLNLKINLEKYKHLSSRRVKPIQASSTEGPNHLISPRRYVLESAHYQNHNKICFKKIIIKYKKIQNLWSKPITPRYKVAERAHYQNRNRCKAVECVYVTKKAINIIFKNKQSVEQTNYAQMQSRRI